MMSSQHRGVVPQCDSTVKPKRKPIRRDPEKRRQQNIQAQRKYREKLRKRLDDLEALAASTCVAAGTLPSTDPLTAALAQSSSNALTEIPTETLPASHATDVSGSTSGSSVLTPGEWKHLFPPLDEIPPAPRQRDSTTHVPRSQSTASALDLWDSSTTHVPQSESTPSALSIFDSPTHIDPSLLTRQKHTDPLSPYWTTSIDCGCLTPHIQIRTQGPDPFNYSEVRILRFSPSPGTPPTTTAPASAFPDPYANTLRVETLCTTAALYTLGMHVGITEEMLCAEESLSPFFRTMGDSTDAIVRASMIGTVQRIFKTLKPDLRPGTEQITVKHHPYIDILPFPTLRKNLIIRQEEFDEDEFFHDLLAGLVCWGGAGVGKRDQDDSAGWASTGTPWDVRSWEARVWFLKKYWSLLGGEEGELVRQSEWWRGIRGEDPVDIEAEA